MTLDFQRERVRNLLNRAARLRRCAAEAARSPNFGARSYRAICLRLEAKASERQAFLGRVWIEKQKAAG